MQNANGVVNELLDKYGKVKLSEISSDQIEMGKSIINQMDLSRIDFDGGKVTRFAQINDSIEMVRYLTSKAKIYDLSEEYVSHYTNYEALSKIINGGMLQLNNPSNMNDGLEFNSPNMDCKKIYFASFSIENGENIGMWSMYGQPWEDGVKISIPKKLFMTWADKIKHVYHVDSKTKETIYELPLEESEFKTSISRVAYVEWDANGNIMQIRCGDSAKNNLLKSVDTRMLTGLIKDVAWSYEKEIRLRVDLNYETVDKKVAVEIPDDIMKNIIITTGPRFDKTILNKEFGSVAAIRSSIFSGKLNYVYCDKCRQ